MILSRNAVLRGRGYYSEEYDPEFLKNVNGNQCTFINMVTLTSKRFYESWLSLTDK